jgi:hypothetical protein
MAERYELKITDEIGANFSLTYHEVDIPGIIKILSYNIIIS